MANYILSSGNRFYVATESTYGTPAPIAPANRFQARHLDCRQSLQAVRRRDKTGARTYLGGQNTAKRVSNFDLSTYLTSWDQTSAPSYGPLIRAAMGAGPELVTGLVVAAATGPLIQTPSPHNLTVGSAVSSGGEIRFISAVQDLLNVSVNVPFSATPAAGAMLATTVGYRLSTQLPSVSIYDYWDPSNAVSRLLTGVGVDKFQIVVRGDTHELTFSGPRAMFWIQAARFSAYRGSDRFRWSRAFPSSIIQSCQANSAKSGWVCQPRRSSL